MTYNFDPDRWYDDELSIIHADYLAGKMPEEAYESALRRLDERHEEMWQRLNGSYQILRQNGRVHPLHDGQVKKRSADQKHGV